MKINNKSMANGLVIYLILPKLKDGAHFSELN